MHSFLKAEWKTILGVIIFCGAIFAWFYVQEMRKAEAAAAPYEYECLRAGDGILDYRLGMTFDELSDTIRDYTQTEDTVLGVSRYERSDGALALNFRDNRVVSIEFYPDKTEPDSRCISDAKIWKSTSKDVAEPIPAGNRVHIIYEGLILIQEQQPDDEKKEKKDIGWIVVPI